MKIDRKIEIKRMNYKELAVRLDLDVGNLETVDSRVFINLNVETIKMYKGNFKHTMVTIHSFTRKEAKDMYLQLEEIFKPKEGKNGKDKKDRT